MCGVLLCLTPLLVMVHASQQTFRVFIFMPFFPDEEGGPEKVRDVCKAMQLGKGSWTIEFQSFLRPALISSWCSKNPFTDE